MDIIRTVSGDIEIEKIGKTRKKWKKVVKLTNI